jgi:hypothetical protein
LKPWVGYFVTEPFIPMLAMLFVLYK